jgi:hypothetical protein
MEASGCGLIEVTFRHFPGRGFPQCWKNTSKYVNNRFILHNLEFSIRS